MILNPLFDKQFISFNRYMVECEFQYLILEFFAGFRFNRYMVECESYTR